MEFESHIRVHSLTLNRGAVEEHKPAPAQLSLYCDLLMYSCYLCRNYDNSKEHVAVKIFAKQCSILPESGEISDWVRKNIVIHGINTLEVLTRQPRNVAQAEELAFQVGVSTFVTDTPSNVNLVPFEKTARVKYELSLQHDGHDFLFLLKTRGFPFFGKLNREIYQRAAVAGWLLFLFYCDKYDNERGLWFRNIAIKAASIHRSGNYDAFTVLNQQPTAARILTESVPPDELGKWQALIRQDNFDSA